MKSFCVQRSTQKGKKNFLLSMNCSITRCSFFLPMLYYSRYNDEITTNRDGGMIKSFVYSASFIINIFKSISDMPARHSLRK